MIYLPRKTNVYLYYLTRIIHIILDDFKKKIAKFGLMNCNNLLFLKLESWTMHVKTFSDHWIKNFLIKMNFKRHYFQR